MEEKFDLTDSIIRYEAGDLSQEEIVSLFSYLIKTGQAWTLQGHYGRMANNFIDNGTIDKNGTILEE